MSTFIERNPKKRAVEEAFEDIAKNGYVSTKPDPADEAFEIFEKFERQATKDRKSTKPATSLSNI